jgi:hypothetical protein
MWLLDRFEYLILLYNILILFFVYRIILESVNIKHVYCFGFENNSIVFDIYGIYIFYMDLAESPLHSWGGMNALLHDIKIISI